TAGPLVRTMWTTGNRVSPLFSARCGRSAQRVPELGFEIFHHDCAPHPETVAPNQRVSRWPSRALRQPAASVSARQYLVFLCRKLRRKRSAARGGKSQSKRSRGTRSRFEERGPAACSARTIGGIITGISFAELLTSKHVAIACSKCPLAFTCSGNR